MPLNVAEIEYSESSERSARRLESPRDMIKTTPSASVATIDEGGMTYDVYQLEVRAYRGSAEAGTLVQRSIGVQVTDAP